MGYSTSLIAASLSLFGLAYLAASAAPEPPLERKLKKLTPERIAEIMIPEADRDLPLNAVVDVDPALYGAQGEQEVIVQLRTPPVAAMADSMTPSERQAHKLLLEQEHASFMQDCGARSAQEVGGLTVLLNALFLNVDAQEVEELANDPNVISIHRVVNDFEKSLDRRVPYIGATTVQQDYGFNGTGIRVAILDSGIDYTHADLGGEGTREAWDAAYKDFSQRDGLFPTEKVVEGYDFVGEVWPEGPLAPDDDPIDIDGHGTHCADIVGGTIGVAPGVKLYAVKVCSAVSSSCSGRALLQGIEYAIDPNGDGDFSDHVDIINMSLGGRYGQPFHDDLSQAVERASAIGVLSVCAAGNARNRPYITNTPASVLSALSVAQTLIPPEAPVLLNVDGKDYQTVFQSWSAPLDESGLAGPFQYGDGNGGNAEGCMEFPEGSLDGKIVLVDRGSCTFTLKSSNIGKAGGIASIIGLVTDESPFDSGDGGDPVTIPAYMISQASSDSIKAMITDNSVGTLDPDNNIVLPSRMAGSSSRGPQNDPKTLIKPEIGGPGGSVSAQASTGTRRTPFSGTSAASPVVAGAAALLLEAFPKLPPDEVKARLMNSAETNVFETEETLAPITRIGSGDVKVDRSLIARTAAWDFETKQPALSFGFVDVAKKQQYLFKTLLVRNYSNDTIIYKIKPTFRFEDDEASGAVKVYPNFPGELQLLPGEDRSVSIVMELYGDLLPGNYMNSGRNGGNGTALTLNEYDGYLILEDDDDRIHVPWHVLPRKAADVQYGELDFSTENPTTVEMSNKGAGTGQTGTFSIIALSENLPEGGPGEQAPTPDIRAVGINSFEVDAGICSRNDPSFVWAFAISSWERQTHLINVRYDIFLDLDQDGNSDYVVLNSDFDGPNDRTDGRQVSLVIDRQTARQSRVFFAEHSMNTANTVLYICAEQIGLSLEDLNSTNVDITTILARDFRYRGPGDRIEDLTVTPGAEQYDADPVDVGPYESGSMPVINRGSFDGNTPEYGLMVISNADRGDGYRGGATQASEVSLLLA